MKVIGYGDNVVDRYLNKNKMFPGGNAINFAVYAKQAGLDSAYLGYFGEDKEAEIIKAALKDIGVDYSKCETEKGTVTERCDVNLVDGNRVFAQDDERDNLHGFIPLTDDLKDYLKGFDLIHSGCYAEMEDEFIKLKGLGPLLVYDFSEEDEYREEEYLNKLCPVLDLALFSCEGIPEEEIKTFLKKIYEKGTKNVLATMGPEGQMFYDGKNFYKGKAKLIEAVDTMGAGDSFFTAFVVSLLKKGLGKKELSEEEIRESLIYAADFAANNCLKEGAFGYSANIE